MKMTNRVISQTPTKTNPLRGGEGTLRVRKMRKVVTVISAFLAAGAVCSVAAFAQTENPAAQYSGTTISAEGFVNDFLLGDGNERTFSSADSGTVHLHNDDGIAAVYVVFNRLPAPWTLVGGETAAQCGEYSFLHEFVDVKELFGENPIDLTLNFDNKTSIAEIYGFSEGEIPDWVQVWEPPCEKADLILFSGHADDEQLFFAGILPYYAGELGLNVQVVYVTNHFDTYDRPHEQLDGLWTVGVKNYPVISEFPDLYSETYEQAAAAFEYCGYSFEDVSGFMVDQIRRFKPLVAVSHDINGEYGHGTHCLAARALMDASERCTDELFRPESAQEYGVWDLSKVYLHSYEENQIIMDWDIPLEKFGGKTAFEMSQQGYLCHKSQLVFPGLKDWLFGKNNLIKKASQINLYSPCKFGLYKTSVGVDEKGGDFFENVKTYAVLEAEAKAEEERIKAEEERKKAEEERIKAEEERKKAEEERIKAEEERQKAEQERLKEEEEKRLAEEALLAQQESIRSRNAIILAALAALSAAAVIAAVFIVKRKKKR